MIDTPAFVWRNKCAYSRCVSVGCIMWPALCTADAAAVNRTLTSHRDTTATFCFSSLFQQIVSLFLVAYRFHRLHHTFRLFVVPFSRQMHSPSHTHRLSSSFFPLSTQRRFELEIFVCSFSFVRLFSYSPFCCVPSSSTCFVVLHIRQAESERASYSRAPSLYSLSELRQCVVYAGTRVWG